MFVDERFTNAENMHDWKNAGALEIGHFFRFVVGK